MLIPTNPRILVTNDDGYQAPGIQVLTAIAQQLSDNVWVCAPLTQQSGMSHSISLPRPLRLTEIAPRFYAVDGTPSDAVIMAVNEVLADQRPDLVLSGINYGKNVGMDVTYSGTIGAAIEATMFGIPAIALSQDVPRGQDADFGGAALHAPTLIKQLLALDWPKQTLMSLNFPSCATDAIKGVRVAGHAEAKLKDLLLKREDRWGKPYYWIAEEVRHPDEMAEDVKALYDGHITVTPLQIDLTAHGFLTALKQHFPDYG